MGMSEAGGMAAPPRGLTAEHRAFHLPQGDACSAVHSLISRIVRIVDCVKAIAAGYFAWGCFRYFGGSRGRQAAIRSVPREDPDNPVYR
jgi:hypothetical protein